MQAKERRFIPIKGHQGIRHDMKTKKYVARKYMDGKEYSMTFTKLSEAINWRRVFHPLLTDTEINTGISTPELTEEHYERINTKPNGIDRRFKFEEMWALYKKQYFPLLEEQTIEDRLKFAKYFFPDLMKLKMYEITPELLDVFMEKKVNEARKLNNVRRMNFNNDLKCLRAFLNWYRENYDGMYVIPVLKRHYTMGIIRKLHKNQSPKMNLDQVQKFFDSFEDEFWRDFAKFHFFMAGRCQEIAGLQWKNIDLEKGIIRISDVAIWRGNKQFMKLKETTKTGNTRVVYLNNNMKQIIENRLANKVEKPCDYFRESNGERLDFVFSRDGQPIGYRAIQYHYNKALQKAGLYPEFSSTHILRKAMANIVRQNMGLDAAQAAGGWKSRNVVERIYSDAPSELNQKVVNFMNQLVEGA